MNPGAVPETSADSDSVSFIFDASKPTRAAVPDTRQSHTEISVAYYPARKKLAVLFLFAVILSVGGAGLVFDPLRLHQEQDILLFGETDVGYYTMLISGIGIASIAGLFSIAFLYRVIYPKLVVTCDRHGFYDRRRMKQPIPLDAISGFECDPDTPDLLGLYTQRPEDYESLSRSLKHRWVRMQRRSPRRFNLPLRFIRISPIDMLE